MSFFIPAAMAQSAGGAAPAGSGFEWIFLIGFVVIFYLMIWRPQAKRAKEHKNLLAGLSTGDEVVTGGGILGKVKKAGTGPTPALVTRFARIRLFAADVRAFSVPVCAGWTQNQPEQGNYHEKPRFDYCGCLRTDDCRVHQQPLHR